MRKKIPIILIIFILIELFLKQEIIKNAIITSANIFFYNVFPFLFPMLLLSDFLIYYNFPLIFVKFFSKTFYHIFHMNSYQTFTFITSFFSGTPANAYIINNLLENNKLTKNEAEYTLSISFFTSPLFYYAMLKNIFPKDNLLQLKLFIIPYIANTIIAFLTKPKQKPPNSIITNEQTMPFSKFFSQSLNKSLNTLLMILGTITFFFIINTIFNPKKNILITGLLEISQGLSMLSKTNLPKALYTLIFISFGGLSIQMQIKNIFQNKNISFKKFYLARFYECLISIILLLLTNI